MLKEHAGETSGRSFHEMPASFSQIRFPSDSRVARNEAWISFGYSQEEAKSAFMRMPSTRKSSSPTSDLL
jgi:hypothetical protein